MYKTYKDKESTELAATFMSDEGLVEFLDARVVVCSDIILCNKEKKIVYLATRKHKPAEGPWVIGGQTKKGESALDTAMRRLKAETTLEVDSDRLEYLTTAELQWSYRQEAPSENGRHDLTRVFGLDISDQERDVIENNLDADEYIADDGLKAYTREDLITARVRPCLIDYFDTLYKK